MCLVVRGITRRWIVPEQGSLSGLGSVVSRSIDQPKNLVLNHPLSASKISTAIFRFSPISGFLPNSVLVLRPTKIFGSTFHQLFYQLPFAICRRMVKYPRLGSSTIP